MEKVEKDGAGAEMGLQEGDIVWGWRREHPASPASVVPSDREGFFKTPFDLSSLETTSAPSGETHLKIRRGTQDAELEVPARDLGVSVRPRFSDSQLQLYRTGRAHWAASRMPEGVSAFQELANSLFQDQDVLGGAWVLQEIGKKQAASKDWPSMAKTFDLARTKVRASSGDLEAHLLESQGDVYERLNRYEEARACYQEALALRRNQTNQGLALSHTYDRLGQLALLPGDFSEAHSFFQESLDLRGQYSPNTLAYAKVLNNLGKVAMEAGNLEDAEGFFKRAYDVAIRNAPESMAYYESLQSLGSIAVNGGQKTLAQQFLNQALKAGERQPDSLYQALNFKHLGDSALKDLSADAALHLYRKAERIVSRTSPNGLEHAEMYLALGDVYRLKSEYPSANTYYLKALAITESTVPNKPLHARALYAVANLKRVQGDGAEALSYFEKGLKVIETLPHDFSVDAEHQATYSARFRAYYRDHIAALIQMNRPTRAFDVSEKYRARALLANLENRELERSSADRRQLRKVRTSLSQLRKELLASPVADNPVNGMRDPYNPKLERLKKEAALLESKLAQVARPDLKPMDHLAVAKTLRPGTALVSYLVTKDRIHTLVIADGKSTGSSAPMEGLAQKVADFRRYLMSPNSPTAQKRLAELSQLLGGALLCSVPMDGISQLIILPDGPLHALPFAALYIPGRKAYLAEVKTLAFADSATTYHQLQKKEQRPYSRLSWLGFGPSKTVGDLAGFKKLFAEAERQVGSPRSAQNDPLPYSEIELEHVSGLFAPAAQVLKSSASSESNVRSLASEVEILHFACHGLFQSDKPEDSALLLAPNSKTDRMDDGFLTAQEIETLNINSFLVVLSACESGLGRDQGGEGAMSLARAFRLAGARSVLASLWRVSDFSTTLLMNAFYGYLLKGHTTSEALALAQRDLIGSSGKQRDLAHPYYWAAFQLLGTDLTR